MRVVLIGSPQARARLRTQLLDTDVEIVGDAPTLAAARAAGFDADALLVAYEESLDPASRRSTSDTFEEPLTPREIQVLELLAEGLPNKAIAARLGISDQTVKFHISSICAKLGAANRTEAVRLGLRRGLISL